MDRVNLRDRPHALRNQRDREDPASVTKMLAATSPSTAPCQHRGDHDMHVALSRPRGR